jgi:hypothetical protein
VGHADGVDESRVIAEGTAEHGLRWILEAGGTDDAYWTGVTTNGVEHLPWPGGIAGPKLYNPTLLNTYTARKAPGPLIIAVRADPTVHRVSLVTASGTESDLIPISQDVIDGLRFFVGFAWPPRRRSGSARLGLRELHGLDADGTLLETEDLSFWDDMR